MSFSCVERVEQVGHHGILAEFLDPAECFGRGFFCFNCGDYGVWRRGRFERGAGVGLRMIGTHVLRGGSGLFAVACRETLLKLCEFSLRLLSAFGGAADGFFGLFVDEYGSVEDYLAF